MAQPNAGITAGSLCFVFNDHNVYFFFGFSENTRETPSPPQTPPRGGVAEQPDSGYITPRGSSWDRPLVLLYGFLYGLEGPRGGFWFGGGNPTRADSLRSAAETLPVELLSLHSRAWRPSKTFIFGFSRIFKSKSITCNLHLPESGWGESK